MYIYTFISTWVHTVIYSVFPAYINNISMRRWHFRFDFPIFGRLPRDVETTYAEGLAVGGVFVMLTMMYYLTTSKARSEIRWTKNWGSVESVIQWGDDVTWNVLAGGSGGKWPFFFSVRRFSLKPMLVEVDLVQTNLGLQILHVI